MRTPLCQPRKTTSELPKVVRPRQFLPLLTWKCALRYDGVQYFISYLAKWLRIRRFSEPTFRPSRAVNRDFPIFSRTCIFFLLTFSSLIFSLLLFYSLTLPTSAFPSVHIVGSLISELPSTSVCLSKLTHSTTHGSLDMHSRFQRQEVYDVVVFGTWKWQHKPTDAVRPARGSASQKLPKSSRSRGAGWKHNMDAQNYAMC